MIKLIIIMIENNEKGCLSLRTKKVPLYNSFVWWRNLRQPLCVKSAKIWLKVASNTRLLSALFKAPVPISCIIPLLFHVKFMRQLWGHLRSFLKKEGHAMALHLSCSGLGILAGSEAKPLIHSSPVCLPPPHRIKPISICQVFFILKGTVSQDWSLLNH
jgi:hypothetical protein